MAAPELVARCFAARTALHFAHLRTRSYAQHMALGELYDAIAEAADKFAECWMGSHGFIAKYPDVPAPTDADPLEFLPDLHDWITEYRDECSGGSTELANLIDEILSTIDRGFYKLKFLK